jgi:hypothetical protein
MEEPHYDDSSLGIEGPAFQLYLAKDRKMIAKSASIMGALVQEVGEDESIYIVLIPGDLTKDGELESHRSFSHYPYAKPVSGVNPEEFAQIHRDLGYGGAISRDPNWLSYAVIPVPGLLIIAMELLSTLWVRKHSPPIM